jgi:hypothetical protein
MTEQQQTDLKNIFYIDLQDINTRIYKNAYNDIIRGELLDFVKKGILDSKNLRKLSLKYKSLYYEQDLPKEAEIMDKDKIDFNKIKSLAIDALFEIKLN